MDQPPAADSDAVPTRKQARYLEQALYVLWKQRVERGDPVPDPRFGGIPLPDGLFFSDGREKLAFQAFRFPFVTDRLSRQTGPRLGRSRRRRAR